MASAANVRRALTREAVEAQVAGNLGDRPLPPAYLVLSGLGEDGRDDFAVAFLLRCRANGFMIAVPSVTRVWEYVEGLLTGDGEPLALVHREQVQAETVRGRHLGPSHVLLLDFPWAALEYLVTPQALRGISDRASRVITLQVGTTPARPCAGDTLDAAARWVERLDPDTAQEYYISAQEHEEAEEHMEQDDLAQPEPELRQPAETARTRPTAPPAGPAGGQPAPRTGALFGSAAPLTAQEITRLRALAGGAPARTGNVERAALVGGVGPMKLHRRTLGLIYGFTQRDPPPPRWPFCRVGVSGDRGSTCRGGCGSFATGRCRGVGPGGRTAPEPDSADPPPGTDAAERAAPSEADLQPHGRRDPGRAVRRRGQRKRQQLRHQGAPGPRGFLASTGRQPHGGNEGPGECLDGAGPRHTGAGPHEDLHREAAALERPEDPAARSLDGRVRLGGGLQERQPGADGFREQVASVFGAGCPGLRQNPVRVPAGWFPRPDPLRVQQSPSPGPAHLQSSCTGPVASRKPSIPKGSGLCREQDRTAGHWPASATTEGPERSGSRRERRGPTASSQATATAKERHSECIGVTGRSLARPGLGSHDKCFPEGRRGASPLPVFDSRCTDLIDPLNLATLLVNSLFGSRTCLAEFTRDSLRTRACTVEIRSAGPDLWPVPPPRWRWTGCTRGGSRARRRQRRLRVRARMLQLVICALNWGVFRPSHSCACRCPNRRPYLSPTAESYRSLGVAARPLAPRAFLHCG